MITGDSTCYKTAAQLGYPGAQYNLGKSYDDPEQGSTQDSNKAIYWYIKAAEQGNVSAMYKLGNYYEENTERPIDEIEAYRWYMLVALQLNMLVEEEDRKNTLFCLGLQEVEGKIRALNLNRDGSFIAQDAPINKLFEQVLKQDSAALIQELGKQDEQFLESNGEDITPLSLALLRAVVTGDDWLLKKLLIWSLQHKKALTSPIFKERKLLEFLIGLELSSIQLQIGQKSQAMIDWILSAPIEVKKQLSDKLKDGDDNTLLHLAAQKADMKAILRLRELKDKLSITFNKNKDGKEPQEVTGQKVEWIHIIHYLERFLYTPLSKKTFLASGDKGVAAFLQKRGMRNAVILVKRVLLRFAEQRVTPKLIEQILNDIQKEVQNMCSILFQENIQNLIRYHQFFYTTVGGTLFNPSPLRLDDLGVWRFIEFFMKARTNTEKPEEKVNKEKVNTNKPFYDIVFSFTS